MFDRRGFLKVCGMSGLGLMLSQGAPLPAEAFEENRPPVPYPYRGWEERYRQVWTWDAEGFAFHCSNCQGNCAWTVYARDGVVIREEQLARYPQIHPAIPDANPRGCNKGGVHSQWRSNPYMLRLQRGLPHLYLNPQMAGERGIGDGDRVRVFNDVGQFYAQAKLHPSAPPWAVVIEHAWEPHQFEGKAGLNGPIAGILSPLELAGGWGHLTFSPNWDGNQMAHESSVEVERA